MRFIASIGFLCLGTLASLALAQPPGPGGSQQGFGYHSAPANRFSVQRGVSFQRYRDQDGYHLRILTRGMDPEAIQVSVQGRSLVVQNQESHRVEQRSDRGSYQFSSSSSNMRRRFPLPPDADASAMQRSLEDGVVVITLPYAAPPRY